MQGLTQRERLIALFRTNGHKVTLGQLLEAGFYECRARFTELRKQGYAITVEQHRENPGRNVYTMIEPLVTRTGPDGQMEIAI